MKKIALLVLSLVAAVTVSNAQVCTLKSNTLALGTGSLNLGAEFSIAPQWTIDLSGMVTVLSPWKNVGGDMNGLYLNGWSGVAEGRYYLCKAFNGHHFGAFGQLARYGKGGQFLVIKGLHNNAQVAALGVSYGYYFKLNTYWGIDTNIGVGYGIGRSDETKASGNYGKYGWKGVPTGRAQVSLCYKF